MEGPRLDGAAGQGEVQALGVGGSALPRVGLEHGQPAGQGLFEFLLGPVRLLADARPVGGGERPQRAEQPGERAGAAEDANPDLLQLGRGPGPGDLCQGPVPDLLDAGRAQGEERAAPRAVSAIWAKAPGSFTASSARILRSSVTPAWRRPDMNAEYDSPS